MGKTIFEKIINGDIPANFVYKDATCVAFLDVNPINPGHVLVVPRSPFKNLYELPKNILDHVFEVVQKIAVAQKSALGAEGVNIIMNNDNVAGQVIFHAHVHVIPRYQGDGYEHWHSKGGYTEGEAFSCAEKIKQVLK